MLDLVLRGGHVVGPDGVRRTDIAIRGGAIVAIGDGVTFPAAERTLNATGMYVLPGLIDSHVHFAQPLGAHTMVDDWHTATAAAACGGVTTVVDFAIPAPGELPLAALGRRQREARSAVIDYGFHGCMTAATPEALGQVKDLVVQGTATVKMFTVYPGVVMLNYGEVRAVLRELAAAGGLALVHAEDETIIARETALCRNAGHLGPESHALSRPPVAETTAVAAVLELLRETGGACLFVHVSSEGSGPLLRAARSSGLSVYAETCPQYLALTEEVYQAPGGEKYICSPPIRSSRHQDALWRMIGEGLIQVINSDHCGYSTAQKAGARGDFTLAPNGLPGVETRLSVLLAEGVARGRLDWVRLAELTSTNVARLMGLYPRKGVIALGADADLVVVDPAVGGYLRAADLHHGSDYTPFEGMRLAGRPVCTISRGEVVAEGGRCVARPGRGQFVARRIDAALLPRPGVQLQGPPAEGEI